MPLIVLKSMSPIDLILFKLACYKDMHKILDEFNVRPDPTTSVLILVIMTVGIGPPNQLLTLLKTIVDAFTCWVSGEPPLPFVPIVKYA